MSRAHVTQDITRAFGIGADTVGMCELETAWHHTEFRRVAAAHGYEVYLPHFGQRGSALGLAVRRDYGRIIGTASIFCAPGRSHVSPSRYLGKMRVERTDLQKIRVDEHHAYSSGWTGTHSLDAFRRLRWGMGLRVVTRSERRATEFNEVVIGGGDLNRPPGTFPGGKVLGTLLSKTGMRAAGYAHTDHTHGGTTFDYVWFLSKRHHVRVLARTSTPAFNSDHDGVLVTLGW